MKHILFVDDDADLLQGLRTRLYKRRHEWDMTFVESASAAVEVLEKRRADLIVTDIRMPGMDGDALLAQVKECWPNTIRVVLSGHSEPTHLMELVTLAHRYLAKPCDAEVLENLIDRCFRLDSLLKDETLKKLVGRIGPLPTLPKTYTNLQTVLNGPNPSVREVADVISADPLVAAKVLQVVNSAFFRLAKKITRVQDAVGYLGFNSIRNMVMSAEVFSHWESLRAPSGLDADRFQSHAQRIAAACAALAAGTPLVDDATLVGLLHDIGYWILLQECPNELRAAMQRATDTGMPSEQAEREVVGASHAEIGAYLLGLWGFPHHVVEAVAFHHQPQAAGGTHFDVLAVLTVAHSLCAHFEDGITLSSEMTPSVDEEYFQKLQPPFDWQEATRRVSRVCETA